MEWFVSLVIFAFVAIVVERAACGRQDEEVSLLRRVRQARGYRLQALQARSCLFQGYNRRFHQAGPKELTSESATSGGNDETLCYFRK